MEIKIYGYFAKKDFDSFTFYNERTDKITTYTFKRGEALYIGVDINGERHTNHLKPAKKKEQAINTFIQDYPNDYVYTDLGTAQTKQLAHDIEKNFISKYQPHFNIYGRDGYSGERDKLNIDELLEEEDKAIEGQRFNNIDALSHFLAPDKLEMFRHKARYVDIIAAKNTGKSFPLDLYKIMIMERDPMASSVTLMKYSTKSGQKGIRSLSMALNEIYRDGFKLANNFEPSTGFYYRLPRGKRSSKDLKVKMKSQFVQFSSFEKSDELAGFTVSNGGYPHLIHIEEPVLQNDNKEAPTLNEWNTQVKTIEDTIYRHYVAYKQSIRDSDGNLLPYKHEPQPFKVITTLNDWDPEHPISKRAERYHPRGKFLDWALGFNYSKLLKLWEDKIIDSETVVAELKAEVDKRWEDIKKSVLKNHTQWVYVEKTPLGKIEDRLIGRMQKFANPLIRNNKEMREETFNEMYNALITGDSFGLAKAFGMGYDGSIDGDNNFVFNKFVPQDTINMLEQNQSRKIIGLSIGWDHDANRGPVATPVALTAIMAYDHSEDMWYQIRHKLLILPQVEIKGYGKGKAGHNTMLYHKEMTGITNELVKKYSKYQVSRSGNQLGTYAIFDDDDGSYVGYISQGLSQEFDYIDSLPNKNGDRVEKGGFSVKLRDQIWQSAIDNGDIIIDKNNTKLIEWLKRVPAEIDAKGEKKRSTKGKWGKRYKDMSNSAEYAWWPFINYLYNGLELLDEDVDNKFYYIDR